VWMVSCMAGRMAVAATTGNSLAGK
jgi:hypothetical protein